MKLEITYFLKVSPWRKILRFGKKGKLSPRFIGPYEILKRIGPVAYRLALPLELANLHETNRISCMCKRCKCNRIYPMMKSQKLYYLEK